MVCWDRQVTPVWGYLCSPHEPWVEVYQEHYQVVCSCRWYSLLGFHSKGFNDGLQIHVHSLSRQAGPGVLILLRSTASLLGGCHCPPRLPPMFTADQVRYTLLRPAVPFAGALTCNFPCSTMPQCYRPFYWPKVCVEKLLSFTAAGRPPKCRDGFIKLHWQTVLPPPLF